jgi:hypothetical protein
VLRSQGDEIPQFDERCDLKRIPFMSLYVARTTKIISFSSVMHFPTTRTKICSAKVMFVSCLFLSANKLSPRALFRPPPFPTQHNLNKRAFILQDVKQFKNMCAR